MSEACPALKPHAPGSSSFASEFLHPEGGTGPHLFVEYSVPSFPLGFLLQLKFSFFRVPRNLDGLSIYPTQRHHFFGGLGFLLALVIVSVYTSTEEHAQHIVSGQDISDRMDLWVLLSTSPNAVLAL